MNDQPRDSGVKPSRRTALLAVGALALMALIWGYNWVVMKVALNDADPSVFAALRVVLSGAFLFFLLAVLRRPMRPTNIRLTIWVGLFQVTGSIGLMTWALQSGAAGKTAVLVYTMPVWLLFMSWGVLGEKLRGLDWVPVILALGGLVFVLAPWDMEGTTVSNLLAVGSGICWAASSITVKILNRKGKIDILSLNAWQMFFGAIPLLIAVLITSGDVPEWTGSFVAALLYNIFLGTGTALLLWFYALRSLPAGTAGLLSLATPVVGVVAAWVQLGERPDAAEAVGMVLILSALAFLALRQIVAARRPTQRE